MAVDKETLKAIARDFCGFELSDEELEQVLPAIESYLSELDLLRELDLSDVMSGRLLRSQERGNQ